MDNKTVMITEAARNLGPQLASLFANEGANLILNTADDTSLLSGVISNVNELGAKAIANRSDVGNQDEVKNLVHKAIENFGGVDVVINNANYDPIPESLAQTTFGNWSRKIQVEVTGTLIVCQAILPSMMENRWGRIINYIGSDGFRGSHITSATTDLGIIGLTRGIAREYKDHNITANCISIGGISPDAYDRNFLTTNRSSMSERLGTPEEGVFLTSSLVSEHSGHITGQCLLLNGGQFFL